MWSKEVSIKTQASREQIWKLWSDVANWKNWDAQVKSSSLNGAFSINQTGEIVPAGGPKSQFEIVEWTNNESFTSRSKLPLTIMDIVHQIDELNEQLIITHKVEFKGILSFLFSKLIGNKVIDGLPKALNELSTQAQL